MQSHSSLRKVAHTFDAFFLGSIFDLLRANKKVREKIKRVNAEPYNGDGRLQHTIAELQKEHIASVDRIQRIENKAANTVIGVGIAVTIITSASATLGIDGPLAVMSIYSKVGFAILVIVGTFFLLVSGYFALRAYEIGEIYRPSLYDLEPLVVEQQAKANLLKFIEQNERTGTLRTNFLSASFSCLRNGLFLVAIMSVVLIVSQTSTGNDKIKTKCCTCHISKCRVN